MSMFVRSYLGRSRYVEELVEDWQIAHQQALLTWDAQELVGECIEHGHFTKRICHDLLEQLFDEKLEDIDRIGESMQIALAKTIRVFGEVDKLIKRIERMDCPTIENGDAFRGVANDTQRVADDFRSQWPSLNRILVRESLAAYERGEYRTAEELLHESQGCGAPAH